MTSFRLQQQVTMMAIGIVWMKRDELWGWITLLPDRPNATVAITQKPRPTIIGFVEKAAIFSERIRERMERRGICAKNVGWTCPKPLVDIKLIVPNSTSFG